MDVEDESQIVKAARCGDVGSLGVLYEHYYAAMVWLAFSILKDRSLAEDAAQEAFAFACEELVGLRRPEKFACWLAAICRNVAHKMARQRSRQLTTHDKPAVLQQSSDDRHEEAVREAIASLQAMHREIVVLRYYNKMSYEQIETFLGIPRSKVKGRLFAARRKIGKYLQSRGLNGEKLP